MLLIRINVAGALEGFECIIHMIRLLLYSAATDMDRCVEIMSTQRFNLILNYVLTKYLFSNIHLLIRYLLI